MLAAAVQLILSDAPLRPRPFDFNPSAPTWALLIGGIIAAALVVYLYTAQQKIASRAIINTLTVIRTLLVLLVFAMLLGPVYQQAHTTHSHGTLWVLLDQSMSMRQTDPQSSLQERLRWADALGYLPAELRPPHLGVSVNRLTALREDVECFRSQAGHLTGDANDRNQREALAHELGDWSTKLASVANDLGNDPQVKSSAANLPAGLRQTASTITQSIALLPGSEPEPAPWRWPKVAGAIIALALAIWLYVRRHRFASARLARAAPALCTSLVLIAIGLAAWGVNQWNDAANSAALASRQPTHVLQEAANIPWQAVHDELSRAITQLAPLADSAGATFLRDHGSDARVQEAMSRLKKLSRADLAYAALTGNSTRNLKALAELMGRQDVKLVPFGDHTALSSPESRDLPQAFRDALKDPAGQNTDIAGALRFVANQVGEDSTVMVVSDGRQNVGSDPQEPARFLASKGTRVFTLTIGSHEMARDAAVDHVDAPDWVYAEDEVVISPVIRLDALRDRDITVELRRGDDLIDTRKLKAKSNQEKVRLRFTDKPKEGVFDYTVKILPVADEAVADNNAQSARVAVKRDKVNVLIVEDEPRWEYQFLRNYLARDHRVKLQVVLVGPAHIENVQRGAQVRASPSRPEGQVDAQLLPSTRQEWSGFDVVVLGDVPPETLGAEQQKDLSQALREGGVKGLLVLAGPRNMPMRYAGTALAELLPVELSGSRWSPQELQDHLRRGFMPAQAPEGLNSILGQFSEDPAVNAQLWASAPLWYWHSEQTVARPGASVIWTIDEPARATLKSPVNAAGEPNTPDELQALRQRALLATTNVGLGRVMYLASPESWRFRYVQTSGPDSHVEDLHRRFWGQVVRWAVGSDLPAGNKLVKFGTNKHNYIGGEPVVVTARVMKEDYSPMQGQSFKIIASRKGAPAGASAGEATMAEASSEGAGIYRGTMTLPAGSYVLAIRGGEPERMLASDSSLDPKQKTLEIEVQPNATQEDRDVNTDPQQMAAIARAGDGVALDGPFFDVMGNHLPVVDRTQTVILQAGLFSSPNNPRTYWAHWIFFGIFVLLITAEWVLRKRGGLV